MRCAIYIRRSTEEHQAERRAPPPEALVKKLREEWKRLFDSEDRELMQAVWRAWNQRLVCVLVTFGVSQIFIAVRDRSGVLAELHARDVPPALRGDVERAIKAIEGHTNPELVLVLVDTLANENEVLVDYVSCSVEPIEAAS